MRRRQDHIARGKTPPRQPCKPRGRHEETPPGLKGSLGHSLGGVKLRSAGCSHNLGGAICRMRPRSGGAIPIWGVQSLFEDNCKLGMQLCFGGNCKIGGAIAIWGCSCNLSVQLQFGGAIAAWCMQMQFRVAVATQGCNCSLGMQPRPGACTCILGAQLQFGATRVTWGSDLGMQPGARA